MALFTVSSEGMQFRQTVESAKYYKWNLDFNVIVEQCFIKTVVMSDTIDACSQIIRGNQQNQFTLDSKGTIQSIIDELSKTENKESAIVCKLKADVKKRKFPSSQGLTIVAMFKATKITRRYKQLKPETIGQKIKVRLMFKEEQFNDKIVRDKLQSLSQDLTSKIVVEQKVPVGDCWMGRFFFAKEERTKQYKKFANWRLEENVEKQISECEFYVDYDEKDRKFPSLSWAKEIQEQEENQEIIETKEEQRIDEPSSKLIIGITGFGGIFTQMTADYFNSGLHKFASQPKDILEKYCKIERNKNMNRLKIWFLNCFYYFVCDEDKKTLGKLFDDAMKIAGGVRINTGHEIPEILKELQTLFIQLGILKREPDAIAMNLYEAIESNSDETSSQIDFHNEEDRYKDVASAIFCSPDTLTTHFSINQHGINGTTEVDILSKHLSVWRFDS